MSTPRKPQGRGVADLLAPRRQVKDREVLPVFPRNILKFDPIDFWIECFMMAGLESLVDCGVSDAAIKAGEFADAALDVAEKRWGKQRVK
jgi:hypothetical protein